MKAICHFCSTIGIFKVRKSSWPHFSTCEWGLTAKRHLHVKKRQWYMYSIIGLWAINSSWKTHLYNSMIKWLQPIGKYCIWPWGKLTEHTLAVYFSNIFKAHTAMFRDLHIVKAWHHSSALQITSYPLWSCILWLMWSFRSSPEDFRYVDTCLPHTRRPSGCWKKLNENFLNNYQYPFMKH